MSISSAPAAEAAGDLQGFLYGRVTAKDGVTCEGRLRWGGDQEAFWSDYFNGFKDQNPWVEYVPIERLPKVRRSIRVLGLWIGVDLGPRQIRTIELDGQGEGGELSVRFDAIRSIARHSDESSRVTLSGGREIVLSGTREAGDGNRGIRADAVSGGDSMAVRMASSFSRSVRLR